MLAQARTKEGPSLGSDFGMTLARLGVADGPAWPDHFGDALRRMQRGIDPIPALSLFSGGGGLDIGFHDGGFRPLEAIEIEPKYVATLERNSLEGHHLEGTCVRCMDIREYAPETIAGKARFVIGGPPCQTFSAAGRRASGVLGTDDARGLLFEEYVRILQEVKPEGFLFENVYGLIGAQGGRAWEAILSAFEALGFNVSHRILDSADYGVPQHRERLIVVGSRGEPFRFPRPTHGPDSSLGHDFYSAGTAVQGAPHGNVPGPVNGRYGHLLEAVPPGLNYSFFTAEMGHPEPIFAWRSKFSDLLYKADPKRPTRTIKAQGGQYTGPFSWESRPFSTAELKRLQTFPDDYTVVGGPRSAVEQIGNSVPPQLARILALAVGEQVFGRTPQVPLDYLDPSEELGFRKRKRALTAHYRQAAAKAISELSGPTDPARKSGQRTKWRRLCSDFAWVESSRSAAGGLRVFVEARPSSLRITVGTDCVAGRVRIEPAGDPGWALPIRFAELRVGSDPLSLTAAWKALEEEIRERFGYADMVQASGYYAYDPKMKGRLLQAPAVQPWPLLGVVMGGVGVGITAPLKELSGLWSLRLSQTALRSQLRELRRLGFEVRSSRTNPQIPKGEFLVPYPFPTLTPDSVQRAKSL
jgi:DNA (cytosine-5)-methyltransferase 1